MLFLSVLLNSLFCLSYILAFSFSFIFISLLYIFLPTSKIYFSGERSSQVGPRGPKTLPQLNRLVLGPVDEALLRFWVAEERQSPLMVLGKCLKVSGWYKVFHLSQIKIQLIGVLFYMHLYYIIIMNYDFK